MLFSASEKLISFLLMNSGKAEHGRKVIIV